MALPILATEPGSPITNTLDAVSRFGGPRVSLNDLFLAVLERRATLLPLMEEAGVDAETMLSTFIEGITVNEGYALDDLYDLALLCLLRAQDALAARSAGVLQ